MHQGLVITAIIVCVILLVVLVKQNNETDDDDDWEAPNPGLALALNKPEPEFRGPQFAGAYNYTQGSGFGPTPTEQNNAEPGITNLFGLISTPGYAYPGMQYGGYNPAEWYNYYYRASGVGGGGNSGQGSASTSSLGGGVLNPPSSYTPTLSPSAQQTLQSAASAGKLTPELMSSVIQKDLAANPPQGGPAGGPGGASPDSTPIPSGGPSGGGPPGQGGAPGGGPSSNSQGGGNGRFRDRPKEDDNVTIDPSKFAGASNTSGDSASAGDVSQQVQQVAQQINAIVDPSNFKPPSNPTNPMSEVTQQPRSTSAPSPAPAPAPSPPSAPVAAASIQSMPVAAIQSMPVAAIQSMPVAPMMAPAAPPQPAFIPPPDGSAVKCPERPEIYKMESGAKRWYPNWDVYASWGQPTPVTVSCPQLDTIPQGAPMPANPATQAAAAAPSGERPDFRCGPAYGNASCGPGRCCSIYGWCGSAGQDHCKRQYNDPRFNGPGAVVV